MELDKAIKERKSVRNYTSKKISHELLMEVLDSARYSPRSGNLQNFYFLVVQSKTKKEKIAEACLKQVWMKDAPVYIIVCNKVKEITRLYSTQGELFSIQNSSAAIENILLKATSLGLGTCWVGAFDVLRLKSILNVPEDIRIEAIITLGYPKSMLKVSRKLPLDRITYFEDWGNPIK